MFDFRTDLADERMEECVERTIDGKIDGIVSERKVFSEKIDVNTVKVLI